MSTSVTAIGNLTRNPQLSRTVDGTPVVNPSLADNARRLVDREWVDTTYRQCAVRRAGPARHASLHCGARAIAVGAVRTHTWSSAAGEDQSALEIVADEIGPSLRWTTTEGTRTPG
jgi:single-strand DNA-binding protein